MQHCCFQGHPPRSSQGKIGVQLLDFDNVDKLFPADVIKRAKEYLDAIPGGTGAYSDSQGAQIIREQIAKVFAAL